MEDRILWESRPKFLPTYINKFFLMLIPFLVYLVIAVPVLLMKKNTEPSISLLMIALGIIGAVLILIFSIALIFIVKAYHYKLGEKYVYSYGGFFSRSEVTIPYNKITNFTVYASLMDRLFNVKSIRIDTAGTPLPESIFYCLKDSGEAEKILNSKLKNG